MLNIYERLQGLESFIAQLAYKAEEQRKINNLKIELAKEIVGMQYYWDDYAGNILSSNNPTEVVAHIRHQVTGQEHYWIFDVLNVIEHLKNISYFKNWKDYRINEYQKSRNEMMNIMNSFNFTEEKINKELQKLDLKYSYILQP